MPRPIPADFTIADDVKTSFPAIVQHGDGAPADVLRLTPMPARCLQVGAHDVLLYVTKCPVHRSDVALLHGGPPGVAATLPAGAPRFRASKASA